MNFIDFRTLTVFGGFVFFLRKFKLKMIKIKTGLHINLKVYSTIVTERNRLKEAKKIKTKIYGYLLGFNLFWGHRVHLPLPLYISAICYLSSSSSRRALSAADSMLSGCFSPAAWSMFNILRVALT